MYLIVVDFEQLCVYVGGERWVGRGFLQILILLNFLNTAERRNFLLRRRRVTYRQHVTLIRRNIRPVERSIVVVRYTAAHCCENIVSLIKKFNLPMGSGVVPLGLGGEAGPPTFFEMGNFL